MAWKASTEALNGLALRNHAIFRKAVMTTTQKRAAESIDIAPPTFSDFDNDHMGKCCLMLAAVGIKLVLKGSQMVDPDLQAAIFALAKKQVEEMALSMQGAGSPHEDS